MVSGYGQYLITRNGGWNFNNKFMLSFDCWNLLFDYYFFFFSNKTAYSVFQKVFEAKKVDKWAVVIFSTLKNRFVQGLISCGDAMGIVSLFLLDICTILHVIVLINRLTLFLFAAN